MGRFRRQDSLHYGTHRIVSSTNEYCGSASVNNGTVSWKPSGERAGGTFRGLAAIRPSWPGLDPVKKSQRASLKLLGGKHKKHIARQAAVVKEIARSYKYFT